jgi:hypothetical protein
MIEGALILIYTHFDMFSYDFRKSLCIFLLRTTFFKLFFHWSLNVRNVFHHLLIYRIQHELNNLLLKNSETNNDYKIQCDYVNIALNIGNKNKITV